jgi:dTDP-4-dehydrorhamnose reductase|tara:strand:+ start:2957 stop:3121 length:165 start_codon:yes stop_codon:yes gene_type:complete
MRIIILGSGGFISKAVQEELEKLEVPILPISRNHLDLTEKNSSKLFCPLKFEKK